MTNEIEDMQDWQVSDVCIERLVSRRNDKKQETENDYYKKKTVGDNRCRDLKKNSSRKSVPIYKPDKILPS